MNETDADLQALYQSIDNPVDQDAAVADEAAADEVETESAEVETDETAAEEVSEEEVVSETEDETEVEDATETEETEEASFQDLLEEIPSNEILLERNKRIPQTSKDEITGLADIARAKQAALDRIGGEDGVAIVEPITQLLSKAERSVTDHQAALRTMYNTNADATSELLITGAMGVLFNQNKDPLSKEQAKTGDIVLQARFGEGVDAAKIEKFALLEKGGYIDVDADMTVLNSEGADSTLFQSQQEKLDAANAETARLQNLVDNPHLINQQTKAQTDAVKDLDAEIVTRLADGITPFRDRVRWGADSILTKTVTDALLAELHNDPEYAEAVKFAQARGTIKDGETIPYTINQKIYTLINKGKARFAERAASINKELRGLTQTSRNAIVQEKVKETKPKAVDVTDRKPIYFGGVTDIMPELADIYTESDRAKRAATA